jgi:glycosyltransferase involved in cell wall biosynthesis
MDILFVTAGATSAHADFEQDNLSGTESQIRGVAYELARQGHRIQILRRGKINSDTKIHNNIEIKTISGNSIPRVSDIPTKLWFSRKVENYIKKENPDVVNITMKYSAIFSCRVPHPVVHFAFNNPADIVYNANLINRITTGTVEKWVASQVDGIVVRNNAAFEWASEHSSSIVRQIPCGIVPGEYQDRGDNQYILFGGRFVDVKNIDHIIRAYSGLPTSLKNRYDLHLVGEGPLEKDLKKLVEDLELTNEIKFQSWLPKSRFREKISKSSAVVLASDQEGMPVFAIEAMACEKPVIGSNVPGIQDLITDGEDGLLFERGDVTELSKIMEDLLKDKSERDKMGQSARKTVETHNSFNKVANEYMDLYEDVINK